KLLETKAKTSRRSGAGDMSDKDSAVEKQVTAMTHHDGASP
ncbi:unnamed protein product, partial [Amoebophrya sp. A25]